MKVLSLGEILWDILLDKQHLGGAPLNFVAHLAKLGCDTYILSSLGDDELGKKAYEAVKEMGINTSYINKEKNYPTGTVEVKLDDGIPSYIINENVAWDYISLHKEKRLNLIETKWDIIYYGTLSQRLDKNKRLIHNLLDQMSCTYTFYDVNLRQDYYDRETIDDSLYKANIVKLNDEELTILSQLIFNNYMDNIKFSQEISKNYDVETVIITLGKNGVFVYANGKYEVIPSKKVDVVDTIGAGDSFSAGFMYEYCKNQDPFSGAQVGVELAGYVVSKAGAIPEYSESILKKLTC